MLKYKLWHTEDGALRLPINTPTFTDPIPLRLPINTPTFALHITTNNINVVITSK